MYYIITDADIQWLRDELDDVVVDMLVEDARKAEKVVINTGDYVGEVYQPVS